MNTKHFDTNTIERINNIFHNEQDYRNHLNNLWTTRRGLFQIMENRPELKDAIFPQFNTLNILIDSLLPDGNYPKPPY